MYGPELAFSEELHAAKYRGKGETFRDGAYRVASALKDGDDHFKAFSNILLEQRFLPAGRVQSAMGALREVTPYNCFVSGTIEDSLVEGQASIMLRLLEAAATMRMGGGIGYDFSTLRPMMDLIKSQQTYASGPVSFMEIYDALCKTIASAGHRRGAQMGILRIDHPDIETFINAKHPTAETKILWDVVEGMEDLTMRTRAYQALQKTLPLTAFNMSIAVTDEFMECLAAKKPFTLKFNGVKYREVDPEALWEMVMRSTWDWAEPGVVFIDTINRMNNLYYCEQIAATNPCAEQPLPPNGACLLGSINLVRYLGKTPGANHYTFDWDQLGDDIPHIIRAMDNIVDRARYPIYEQKKEARSKRRMGIGVTGLANCIETLGNGMAPYGSLAFVKFERQLLRRINRDCYIASIDLAKEKGSFPLFDAQQYLSGDYIATLDEDVRDGIARSGIRNSHLTSIAPTGTISLCADNVSSGIEPVFSYSFLRDVLMPGGATKERIEDYGVRVLKHAGRQSRDVTIQHHLDVLIAAQDNVDSAVAKTCNVGADIGWDDFKRLYFDAWEHGAKGCTTFRDAGKRLGIFTVKDDDAQPSDSDQTCYIDPTNGRHECE